MDLPDCDISRDPDFKIKPKKKAGYTQNSSPIKDIKKPAAQRRYSPSGFGSSAGDRFGYVDQQKERKNFSCLDDLKGDRTKNREASYSFGTSRSLV